MTKINEAGLALIKQSEGCRLTAYPDPGTGNEPLTIGYGHTSAAGEPKVSRDMVITQQQAEDILRSDLAKYEDAVSAAVAHELTENQFAACVSLCYNIGPGNFAKSSVVRFINQGRMADAADAFALWNRAAGKILPGLVKRRAEEAALFSTDVASASPAPAPAVEEKQPVEMPQGKPLSLSTTNVAAGVAAAATVSASAKEIATNASSVFSGQNAIGVLALVVLAALGWIVYQRYTHKRDWGI
jgi:lysozyme